MSARVDGGVLHETTSCCRSLNYRTTLILTTTAEEWDRGERETAGERKAWGGGEAVSHERLMQSTAGGSGG